MQADNMGLLFWGTPGTGKTYAAACIANDLCDRGVNVRMTTLGTVLNKLPGLPPQEKLRYLQDLTGCDLLILDDFGMERDTSYSNEQIFSLIDGRYLSGKPMIVTTNLNFRQFREETDMAARRLYDRLLERCVPIVFDGKSQRRAAGKNLLRRYKEIAGAEEESEGICD